MSTKGRSVYGYGVLFALYAAIAIALSFSTGFWWAGLAFIALTALIATAIVCIFRS